MGEGHGRTRFRAAVVLHRHAGRRVVDLMARGPAASPIRGRFRAVSIPRSPRAGRRYFGGAGQGDRIWKFCDGAPTSPSPGRRARPPPSSNDDDAGESWPRRLRSSPLQGGGREGVPHRRAGGRRRVIPPVPLPGGEERASRWSAWGSPPSCPFPTNSFGDPLPPFNPPSHICVNQDTRLTVHGGPSTLLPARWWEIAPCHGAGSLSSSRLRPRGSCLAPAWAAAAREAAARPGRARRRCPKGIRSRPAASPWRREDPWTAAACASPARRGARPVP